MQDTITYSHPSKIYAGKKFLIHTWNEVHRRYVEQSEFHRYGVIAQSTMRTYKPKNILLSGQTPVNQCMCDYCENCDLLVRALLAVGLKNIPSNKYHCLDSTFCHLRKGQFGTTFSFAPRDCIKCNCNNYGTDNLKHIIKTSNEDLLKLNRNMTWH